MGEYVTLFVLSAILFYPDRGGQKEGNRESKNKIIKIGF